jgi:dynein heavy chain, axonemal
MLMTKPVSVTTLDTFARLWLHECSRVFSDRLINRDDRDFFRVTATDLLKSKFKVNWNLKENDPFNGST